MMNGFILWLQGHRYLVIVIIGLLFVITAGITIIGYMAR